MSVIHKEWKDPSEVGLTVSVMMSHLHTGERNAEILEINNQPEPD